MGECTLCACGALHALPCLYHIVSALSGAGHRRSSALVATVMISRYRRGLCHDIAIHKKSMIRALEIILLVTGRLGSVTGKPS